MEKNTNDTNSEPLARFPKLWKWYLQNKKPRFLELSHTELFLWQICQSFNNSAADAGLSAGRAINRFLDRCHTANEEFRVVQQICTSLSADLIAILAELSETIVRLGNPHFYQTAIARFADSTQAPELHFLAGWLSLNLNDFSSCLHHSEQIEEPSAETLALIGQAHLESGELPEAIEALNAAITLSPNDPMFRFQAAKACHLDGKHRQALTQLNEIMRIDPGNDEVLYYKTIILAEGLHCETQEVTRTVHEIMQLLSNRRISQAFATTSLIIALRLDQDRFIQLLQNIQLDRLFHYQPFLKRLSAILRTLGENGWNLAVQYLAEKGIETTSSGQSRSGC